MKFEYPEIEVVKFAVEDIITASGDPSENTTTGPTLPAPVENELGWS